MADGGPVVVVADPLGEAALVRLRSGAEVRVVTEGDEERLREALREADALIVRTRTVVSAGLLEAAGKLRVIGRAGSGLDNIDVQAAEARGITVVYTPAAATRSVAELTIGFIVMLARSIGEMDRGLRSGDVPFERLRGGACGLDLADATLGIIGMGRIGRLTARMAHDAFGMRIVHHDIREVRPVEVPSRALSREALLGEADVVSLHVPLTDVTRHMVDGEFLRQMRRGALLINTARGAVVESEAVAEALAGGRLGGYAADVIEPEPPPPDHPLLSAPRCVLTPHIGARTPAAQAGMDAVVEDVLAVLAGREPQFRAAPEAAAAGPGAAQG